MPRAVFTRSSLSPRSFDTAVSVTSARDDYSWTFFTVQSVRITEKIRATLLQRIVARILIPEETSLLFSLLSEDLEDFGKRLPLINFPAPVAGRLLLRPLLVLLICPWSFAQITFLSVEPGKHVLADRISIAPLFSSIVSLFRPVLYFDRLLLL